MKLKAICGVQIEMANSSEIQLQRDYYSRTAGNYEDMHVDAADEHYFALSYLVGMLDFLGVRSILDIGCGTGRALRFIKQQRPEIRVVGVEPVEALRNIGYSLGLSAEELIDGDATKLSFQSGEFDLVCEFGVLHHIPNPEAAVSEMLRVARLAVFISDSNNFGGGSFLARSAKQLINALGLWAFFNFVKTGGKGYSISEGDGIAYSYSVFNNYAQIRSQSRVVHLLNTCDGDRNIYRSSSHVALLATKKR